MRFLAVMWLPIAVLSGCSLSAPSVKSGVDTYPEFPWPPPRASSQTTIPDEMLRLREDSLTTYADVDRALASALTTAGYVERSYYAIPDGFVVVARLEQINPDGTPKSGSDRWATDVGPLTEFSLAAYLRALFTSRPGYFRVIAFAVTPHPFAQSDIEVTSDEALRWLGRGLNRLPASMAEEIYSDAHTCSALVYEFEKHEGADSTLARVPGRLPASTHLESSNLLDALRAP